MEALLARICAPILLLAICLSSSNADANGMNGIDPLTSLAFGSCNKQKKSQSYWSVIAEKKPQLWIWGGDNIYADFYTLNMRRAEYLRLKENPHYKSFRGRVPVIGTWDDHDYAYNNAGKGYRSKAESQKLFLDFLDEPFESPRRSQKGVYASYSYGAGSRAVKIILLDERYFREKPSESADVLGGTQWTWFEEQMTNNEAGVTLIVSSSQVIPIDHFGDSWGQYPKARARFLEIIERYPGQVVILSGDRHHAELSLHEFKDGRRLYELTASGLNRPGRDDQSPNRYRVGERRRELNFGMLRFDWKADTVDIHLEVWSMENKKVLNHLIDGVKLGHLHQPAYVSR
ncbi:MAG: alkaline phosphatase D family protein [Bdellovibrionota bacterium]